MKTADQEINLSRTPTIILIRPQLGENIGAVARAMLNFGLSELRIVDPRDGWPNQHAIAVASGAGSVLDTAKFYSTTLEACSDLHFIFAATVRARGLSKKIFYPKEAIDKTMKILHSGLRVGLMFGPERSGLRNADIALSQAIISVPTNPNFSSLNLAQCVVLLTYEWFNLSKNRGSEGKSKNITRLASRIEVQHLKLALFEKLSVANYFWPEDKKASLAENLIDLLGRLELTSSDIRTLHGVIKTLGRNHKDDL